ncbi:MAG TPA: hypothetical protein VGH27_20330 [Streptosporangiaceae bacterium]|jgi:hypothetical protein
MRKVLGIVPTLAVGVALLTAAAPASAAPLSGGTWGNAQELPGIAALDKGGHALVQTLSCASAGNCVTGGYYTDGSDHSQAFVAVEKGGTWGDAQEVPGTAALNTGGDASVASVSCASAGNCAVGGDYTTASSQVQPYVANETSGAWGTAEQVPGSATLNKGGNAGTEAVSCASAGDCSAVGLYTDGSGNYQAFAVSEAGGTWGNAEEVPGVSTLDAGGASGGEAVSCSSLGHCAAAGDYTASGVTDPYVVSET